MQKQQPLVNKQRRYIIRLKPTLENAAQSVILVTHQYASGVGASFRTQSVHCHFLKLLSGLCLHLSNHKTATRVKGDQQQWGTSRRVEKVRTANDTLVVSATQMKLYTTVSHVCFLKHDPGHDAGQRESHDPIDTSTHFIA